MIGPVAAALADFRADPGTAGWRALPFFRDGAAQRIAAPVDARTAAGAAVLPPAAAVFAALTLTPFERTKVVILGQDPYPTPGDAHGLAFSYRGGPRTPPKLKKVLPPIADHPSFQAP